MIFVKVDVKFFAHEKFRAVGLDGVGLWLSGLAYSRDLVTSGWVPDAALPMFGGLRMVKSAAQKLVDVGLWIREEGGYRIHNYAEKGNQTKEQVEEMRESARMRAAKSRDRRSCVRDCHTVTDQQASQRTTAGLSQQHASAGVLSASASASVSLSEQDTDPEVTTAATAALPFVAPTLVPSAPVGALPADLVAIQWAYEAAIRAASRQTFAVRPGELDDLWNAIRAHAIHADSGLPVAPERRAEWVEHEVPAFVEHVRIQHRNPEQRRFWNLSPKSFLRWLNETPAEGSPSAPERPSEIRRTSNPAPLAFGGLKAPGGQRVVEDAPAGQPGALASKFGDGL